MSGLFEDDDYVIKDASGNLYKPTQNGNKPMQVSGVSDIRSNDNSVYGGAIDNLSSMQQGYFKGTKVLDNGTAVRKRSAQEYYKKNTQRFTETLDLNVIFKEEHNIQDQTVDQTIYSPNSINNAGNAYANLPLDDSGVPIDQRFVKPTNPEPVVQQNVQRATNATESSSGITEGEVNLTDAQIQARLAQSVTNPNMVNIKSELLTEDEYIESLIGDRSKIDFEHAADDLFDEDYIDENKKIEEPLQNNVKNEENNAKNDDFEQNFDDSESLPPDEVDSLLDYTHVEEYEEHLSFNEEASYDPDNTDFTSAALGQDEEEDIADILGIQLENTESTEEELPKQEVKPQIVKKVFNKESLKNMNKKDES